MSAMTDPKVAGVLATLSPRQREVLDLVAEGLPNKLIARRLDITEATTKLHVKSLLRAFGAGNRTQLALLVRGAPPALADGEDLPSRLAATEARFARLLVAFHDATRRPLGVTPDSGAEFYEHRLAEEAEARRPGIGTPAEIAERPEARAAEAMRRACRKVARDEAGQLDSSWSVAAAENIMVGIRAISLRDVLADAARSSSPTTGGAA